MESYEIIWKMALPELDRTVSTISYANFITQLTPVNVVGNKMVFITATNLFANHITETMREKIISALDVLSSKRVTTLSKKHTNIPL